MVRIIRAIFISFLFMLCIFLSSCTPHPIADTVASVLFVAGSPLILVQACIFQPYEKDFSHEHSDLIGREFRTLVDLDLFAKTSSGRIIKKGTYYVDAIIKKDGSFQRYPNEISNTSYIPAGTKFKIIKVIGRGDFTGSRLCNDKLIAEIAIDGKVEEMGVERLFKEHIIMVEPYRMFEPNSSCIKEI